MRVLLIGSGAREHTIAWKLRQSSRLSEIFVAPGNAGTKSIATNIPVVIPKPDAPKGQWRSFNNTVTCLARWYQIDLVVIGPEGPLSSGLTDRLTHYGIKAFGPYKSAARVEYSKIWSSRFMQRNGIPQPQSWRCLNFEKAKKIVDQIELPVVIKADGLAAGKGVVTVDTYSEAINTLRVFMVDQILGVAGKRVLLQERLVGREVSAHAFTNGHDVVHMPFSCDYKRIGVGDTGKNTGGIGCYSPAVWLEEAAEHFIRQYITERSIRSLEEEDIQYRGVFYPGLMVIDEGPKALEFNCRFGDPETQVLLPRLQGDLLEIMNACVGVGGKLVDVPINWDPRVCVCVVLCSGGYPGSYKTGFPITGLDRVPDDVIVFHAGTKLGEDGQTLTDGGRVLSVVALGETLEEARWKVFEAIGRIYFKGMYYRHDIALV